MSNVVKFPYNVARSVHSRKPRRSKNGTPEERAAKEAASAAAMPGPASVISLSRDQPMPPIVDQAERIVAKYNQLDPDRQAFITKFVDYLIAKQDTE